MPHGIDNGIGADNGIDIPTGRQLAQIRSEAQDKGDLGLVAESSRCTQRTVVPPAPLSASGVLGKLREMAAMSGNAGSLGTMWVELVTFLLCQRCCVFCSLLARRLTSSRDCLLPAGTQRHDASSGEDKKGPLGCCGISSY